MEKVQDNFELVEFGEDDLNPLTELIETLKTSEEIKSCQQW